MIEYKSKWEEKTNSLSPVEGGITYVYRDFWLIRPYFNPPKIVWEPMGADYWGLTVCIVQGYV